MPLNRTQCAQLLLLLLALPAQYFLSEWWGSSRESSRTRSVQDLLRSAKETAEVFKSWVRATGTYILAGSMFKLDLKKIKQSRKPGSEAASPDAECIAKEVFRYNDRNGYFSQSTTVRSPRPKGLRFRVGQVITHKKYKYRGVIIGWDESCRAPQSWIETMHHGNPGIENTPHYSVLVDARDRVGIQTTYVAQENIQIVTNIEVQHPSIWDYFNFYDGAQYHMRPAMQELYPHD